MTSLLPSCCLLLLLLRPAMADVPLGTIERSVKQQILATIHPGEPQASVIFLTSPSGKYAAYFLRRATAPYAGGFGNDFCFVQVEDAGGSGESVWESECTPVSTSNTCSLVFDDNGLEVFDGSREAWSSEANGFHPNTLQLVDLGDMRITDKDGELAWRASDVPLTNQGCGLPGSPGLGPNSPPFAGQIGVSGSLPFGLPATASPSEMAAVAGDSAGEKPGSAGDVPVEPDVDAPVVDDGGLAPSQVPVVPTAAPVIGDGDHSVGGGVSIPFGQPAATLNGRRPEEGGIGLSGQPLVDNTPYDSGCLRGVESSAVGFGLSAVMVVAGILI